MAATYIINICLVVVALFALTVYSAVVPVTDPEARQGRYFGGSSSQASAMSSSMGGGFGYPFGGGFGGAQSFSAASANSGSFYGK